MRSPLSILAFPLLAASASAAPVSYNREIRPILSENCFYCHGQDANKRKKNLQLNTEAGQRANDMVVPGDADKSKLIQRLFTQDPEKVMPPPDSNRHMTAEQRELFKRWVAEGAKFEGHWAFQAPLRPALPVVANVAWVGNPIDQFILARLEQEGLPPSPEATKETLLRRVSLDLAGLPPSPAEVAAFLSDVQPGAYERLVDRLIANPHYGERMALPWLDAARYADSNGFQQDGDTFQWIWRDWVVKAFNDNMPFDQFTIEQLAGDLLPNATQSQKIATAFNRNHMLNGEGGAIPEEQRNVILFDRVDVTATNWLALTMACSQCHDHKYDPITQRDYYSLMAAFNNIPENGLVSGSSFKVRVADPVLDVASDEQKARRKEMETKLAELKKAVGDFAAKSAEQLKAWIEQVRADDNFPDKAILEYARQNDANKQGERDAKLKKYFEEKVAPKIQGDPAAEASALERKLNEFNSDEYPRVMVMQETKPRETHLLDRGNYESPKEKVDINIPGFLPALPADAPKNRLGIAKWLVSAEQPLTARVIVNRFWQDFMGRGIVKTAEDFGVQSESPTHQELLDWMAVEFRESGWNVKKVVRLIVTSNAYKQSSKLSPANREKDPENRLFGRGARHRLPAMMLRDQALKVSGLLTDKLGGKPVYPYQPANIWDGLAITKERSFDYPISKGEDLYRRSLYTFWRRTVAPSNMFDASTRNTCRVRSATTNTPLQALTLLNDATYVEAARALAQNLMLANPASLEKQLSAAFQATLIREPDAVEMRALKSSHAKQLAKFKSDPAAAEAFLKNGASSRNADLPVVQHAALSAVCLAILNLDETLSRE